MNIITRDNKGKFIRFAKIYSIKNKLNGKKYVGSTIGSLQSRFRKHYSYTNNLKLTKDMKSFGKENFEITLLEECSIEDRYKQEAYWTKKLKTFKQGYNLNIGIIPSEATKIKMSKKALGRTINNNTRKIPIQDVPKILKRLLNGERQYKIAREYKVYPSTISGIYRKHRIKIGLVKPRGVA